MALFKEVKTYQFQNEQLFRDLIEVSEIQFERYGESLHPRSRLMECASVISLGRQTGATTALVNIANEKRDEVTILVLHNNSTKDFITRDRNLKIVGTEANRNLILLAQNCGEYTIYNLNSLSLQTENIRLIFDACSMENTRAFIEKLVNNCPSIANRVKSVLVNQPLPF